MPCKYCFFFVVCKYAAGKYFDFLYFIVHNMQVALFVDHVCRVVIGTAGHDSDYYYINIHNLNSMGINM